MPEFFNYLSRPMNLTDNFITRNKLSIYGGVAATIFTGLGVFLLGNVSGYEAKQLITSSLPGVNMLCNTIILGSATILALLLTVLGVSSNSKSKLKKAHYRQVLLIAKLDTIVFVVALVMFQFFNIPITEAENVEVSWFEFIYWATLLISSIMSGMMITVILMLYSTITNIIHIVGLEEDHYLISKEEAEKSASKNDD